MMGITLNPKPIDGVYMRLYSSKLCSSCTLPAASACCVTWSTPSRAASVADIHHTTPSSRVPLRKQEGWRVSSVCCAYISLGSLRGTSISKQTAIWSPRFFPRLHRTSDPAELTKPNQSVGGYTNFALVKSKCTTGSRHDTIAAILPSKPNSYIKEPC